MDKMQNKQKRGKLIAAIAACCTAALVLSALMTLGGVRSELSTSSEKVTANFTTIMDNYTHSFELMAELLQQKIDDSGDPAEIEQWLKGLDGRLGRLEGADYDGVYMCYQGQYLYSWDTPRSVYEASGYVVTERPWYTGAVEAAGDVWFSVPYRSYANDYMLATISRLQPDGETVLAYDIKLGAIQSFVNDLVVQSTALTLICDKEGNIIGTTDPRYAGGNYLADDAALAQDVTQAQAELEESAPEEETKARAKVTSAKAVESFCTGHRKLLTELPAQPGTIFFSGSDVAFAYCGARYDCLVLTPMSRLLPELLLLWVGLSLVLVLAVLLAESMTVRIRAARELEQKNAELAEAVVRADAASVAKSRFLAQMSHEIRTPMNAIIGLTSIAKTEVRSPEKVSDDLHKIEGSSRLLLSIINDVLDMSAIEGGKLKIDSAEFNFRTMLQNITTLFYEQARQKGITFEVRMNGVTEEIIVGDELRVNQVLMNLLSNAMKFTPAGGEVDLMVLQASRSQGKVQLRFSVSDNGCGMSKEMLGRLFKPFEQESASTARKHGGSGLGLSITKKLVEMMGGTIQVQSTQGKGSVFTADIPFQLRAGVAEPVAAPSFNNIRALVVDDDVDSCEYSGILLERLGVRHEYVTGGEAALERLGEAEEEGDPFTLCLIDWKMPEMNGGELTRQIREIFGEDAIIIIVSAYDLNEVEGMGDVAGSNYFISKPLFQSTLFNALMKISGGDYTRIDAGKEKQDYDFTGKRVLLAEDVALNMEVAVKLLNMVGVEVTCAEDGRQAVDLFTKPDTERFDCILLDINMPVMDGYEAARAIRACGKADAKTVPIYAMTANAFAEDVTAALNAGMNGHIAKPIETAVLYKTLENAFSEGEKSATEK